MRHKLPLILGFDGKTLDRETIKHLDEINPVGLILFKRNLGTAEEIHQLIREIKDLLGDVILSIDHEGGLVNRFGPQFAVPPAAYSLQFTAGSTQKQGAQLLAALPAHFGFNLNFAPVVDLHHQGGSIGSRAFCESPQRVKAWGELSVAAHEAVGVGACLKHFPGHGRVSLDSHQSEVTLDSSLEELLGLDLVPYIDSAAPVVMASHVLYPELDPQLPASLSKRILKDLLKGQLGYPGLVVTDCLEMNALDKYSPTQMVDLGIEAELDLWVSSFSLKKSRAFQRELAARLREKLPGTGNPKIGSFLKTYQPKKTALPALEQAIRLRSEVIQKQGELSGGPLALVRLGGSTNLKVNQGESSDSFCDAMVKFCPDITEVTAIPWEDIELISEKFVQWRNEGRLVLVACDHEKLSINRSAVLEKLAKGAKLLHLNLGDNVDLMEPQGPKWQCFGSDCLTAQAICSQLNLRLNQSLAGT